MRYVLAVAGCLLGLPLPALAKDTEQDTFTLTVKNHVFEPASLKVPAKKRITLIVRNEDDVAEEFESHGLKREKVIPAKDEIRLLVGPLSPGTYNYFGEFHPDTANGEIIAE